MGASFGVSSIIIKGCRLLLRLYSLFLLQLSCLDQTNQVDWGTNPFTNSSNRARALTNTYNTHVEMQVLALDSSTIDVPSSSALDIATTQDQRNEAVMNMLQQSIQKLEQLKNRLEQDMIADLDLAKRYYVACRRREALELMHQIHRRKVFKECVGLARFHLITIRLEMLSGFGPAGNVWERKKRICNILCSVVCHPVQQQQLYHHHENHHNHTNNKYYYNKPSDASMFRRLARLTVAK